MSVSDCAWCAKGEAFFRDSDGDVVGTMGGTCSEDQEHTWSICPVCFMLVSAAGGMNLGRGVRPGFYPDEWKHSSPGTSGRSCGAGGRLPSSPTAEALT